MKPTLTLPAGADSVAIRMNDSAPPMLARFSLSRPATRQDVANAFGEVLRSARSAVGLSQEDLAHWAGWDRTYPSLLERALRTPSLMQLLNMAPPLSLRPGLLVDRTASLLGHVSPLFIPRSDVDMIRRICVNAERLRIARGLTENQFATRTGLDRRELRQMQRGGYDTSLTRLDGWARGLDCDVMDFLMTP